MKKILVADNTSVKSVDILPSRWANVSGGKDSLFMLLYLLEHRDIYPLDGVVHFNLGIDFPFVDDVVNHIKHICYINKVKFLEIKPRVTWEECFVQYGLPNRTFRWCNKLKVDCSLQLEEYLRSNGYFTIHYIGFCADEIQRLKADKKNVRYLYPLVENGINEDFILEWAKKQPIFNDYYKFNKRQGCMYCPMMSIKSMAYLAHFYPSYFDNLIRMARLTEAKMELQLKRPFSVWQSNAKYNTDHYYNMIQKKYLPILRSKINIIEGYYESKSIKETK